MNRRPGPDPAWGSGSQGGSTSCWGAGAAGRMPGPLLGGGPHREGVFPYGTGNVIFLEQSLPNVSNPVISTVFQRGRLKPRDVKSLLTGSTRQRPGWNMTES